MKILITGGSGFLGKNVIQRLVKNHHDVWALSRSASSAEIVANAGATPLSGDITNVKFFANKLDQFDAVVHCAAPVEFWGPWEKFQVGIIDSTIQLAIECDRQGVKRFIHISSESVLQDADSLLDINESYTYPHEPNSFYGKAKKIAEERLLNLSAQMEIIILRPSFIWGPGCPSFVTISDKVKAGQFVWIDQGEIAFEAVHVENVAEAVNLALFKGKDRGVYFVTDGESSTVKHFFSHLFQSLGLHVPTRSIPSGIARPVANLVESIWKFLGIKSSPPITRFDLAFIAMPRRYSTKLIEAELGYTPLINRIEGFRQLTQI